MYETSCWQPPGCWPTSVRGGMIADKDNAIQPVLKCLTHRKVPLHELTPRSEGGTSCFPVARRRNRVALKMATLRDPSLGSSCRFYIDTQFIGVWHARVDPRVSELLAPHQPAALARTSGEWRVARNEWRETSGEWRETTKLLPSSNSHHSPSHHSPSLALFEVALFGTGFKRGFCIPWVRRRRGGV